MPDIFDKVKKNTFFCYFSYFWMGNAASASLNLPFGIASEQTKKNDARIITLANFFREIGLKTLILW